MALKCTSCSGDLVYHIPSKQLFCSHCDNYYPVEQFDTDYQNWIGEGSGAYAVDVYDCENCGAEITVPEEQIVAYCAYCGGQVVLKERSAPEQRPTKIIPFVKTKADAEKAYGDAINRIPYLPKEFKDASFLEAFRGIYIPYWRKTFQIGDVRLTIPGNKYYTSGSYDYYETYEIQAEFSGEKDCSYDASYAFDDSVAAEIAPFHLMHSKDFHEGYLAGFYADRVTVPADTYDEIARQNIGRDFREDIKSRTGVTPGGGDWESKIPYQKKRDEVALFPVWFLTWRRGKRVAYSVLNGQTGKLSIDLPVDYRRFFKITGIWAIVLFLLLCILPIFMLPVANAGLSALLLIVTSIMMAHELRDIDWMENHKFDLGYLQRKREEKAQAKGEDPEKELKYRKWQAKIMFHGAKSEDGLTKTGVNKGMGWKIALWTLLVLLGCGAVSLDTPSELCGFLGILLVLQCFYSTKILYRMIGVRNKLALLSSIISAAVVLISCVIAGPSHPQDYWYYGISVGCLGTMILNILASIYYINFLTTRPVPNFFTREGANNARENY